MQAFADNQPNASLENNASLFTVLTAINSCGYDAELNASAAVRSEVRDEVAKAVAASDDLKESHGVMCQFYRDHQQEDAARTLAQYVSLALYLNEPPALTLKAQEADLPPDASYVSGLVPMLQNFYGQAGLRAIWERHQAEYSAFTDRYHEPLSKMLFDTEIYLKMPSAGYLGHSFTVFLDPMGAPGQTNARNYGADYFVVISPGNGSDLKMEQIRHTYLHYLLDPFALKYPTAMGKLGPLLDYVKTSPIDSNFKGDASLLVTECLIRAVEAHNTGSGKNAEAQRQAMVDQSVGQGFILTSYFYGALERFEKEPTGLRDAYSELLTGIDIGKEEKQAAQVHFASKAEPELLNVSQPTGNKLLATAEERLSAGDTEAAKKLAQQALDGKNGDPGRALFVLAQAATASRDVQGARNYFEQALGVAQEPSVVAWSHIYLGRIFDLQENRAAALDHYRAALSAGASLPEAKAAAERGIEHPYEPRHHAESDDTQ